jgi:hypothetical protein
MGLPDIAVNSNRICTSNGHQMGVRTLNRRRLMMQKSRQRMIAVHEIRQKKIIKRGIECINGLVDCIFKPADGYKGAGVARAETLRKWKIGFKNAKHAADIDLVRITHQLQSAMAATCRIDKAVQTQQTYDLAEVMFGRVAGCCDIRLPDYGMRIHGAIH